MYNFGVIVGVAPAGAQSNLKLVSAEGGDGERQARGCHNCRKSLYDVRLFPPNSSVALESGGWQKESDLRLELHGLIGYGVVLPGRGAGSSVAADVPCGRAKK